MSAGLRRARAAAQRLVAPAAGPVEAVRHLLAVQAQDWRSARLALRARTVGATAADVDTALEDGSLLVGWLLRGTLHLVTAGDYAWLHALTAPSLVAGNARRLRQEGVPAPDAERAVEVVRAALAAGAPLTRAQLAARMAA